MASVSQNDVALYLSKVRAKYGVDLSEGFARDFLAFTFEMDERYRALQAELDHLRAESQTLRERCAANQRGDEL